MLFSLGERVSHPYKTSKIIILDILIFWFLNSEQENSEMNDSKYSHNVICSELLYGYNFDLLLLFSNI
jgi:hypothetical protein